MAGNTGRDALDGFEDFDLEEFAIEEQEAEQEELQSAIDEEFEADFDVDIDLTGLARADQFKQNYVLTEAEILSLRDKVFQFCEAATGIQLYPYQVPFAKRIIESVLLEDCEEIAALFSRQSGKCLAPETLVLMYDGSFRRADAVREGDLLMGDDSTPRTVLSVCEGEEEMFEIRPVSQHHEPYRVNASHILTVMNRDGDLEDVPLSEVRKHPRRWSGVKLPVELAPDGSKLAMPPYEYGRSLVGRTTKTVCPVSGRCVEAHLVRELAVHDSYRLAPLSVVREVLAGVLDEVAHAQPAEPGLLYVNLRRPKVAEALVFMARRCGLRASVQYRRSRTLRTWTVVLYGPVWELPTQTEFCPSHELRKPVTHYAFDVVPLGRGRYNGFQIDGNRRFMLADCTVTHNTEAVSLVVCGCAVILPKLHLLSERMGQDSRLLKFKDGFWAGIFAPTDETCDILRSRLKTRMRSPSMREVLKDPDIDLNDERQNAPVFRLQNGSVIDVISASPQKKIEGRTYHLLLTDETQDITDSKLRKSIEPMGAAVAATLVKIGTPNEFRGDFYQVCQRGRAEMQRSATGAKNYFENDYRVVMRYNPRYKLFLKKTLERIDRNSMAFQTSYALHWPIESSQVISPETLKLASVTKSDSVRRRYRGEALSFRRSEYLVKSYLRSADEEGWDNDPGVVCGLDIGRSNDSTVLTIGKVFWTCPDFDAGQERYMIHVLNWYEWRGDDHEKQFHEISKILREYKVARIAIDSTGRGEPIYDRIAYDFSERPDTASADVIPFVFSLQSKHHGYTLLLDELKNGRITFPSGYRTRKSRKYDRFLTQMSDLERRNKGRWMQIQAREVSARGEEKPHDDYPDSLMLMCWAANKGGVEAVETAANPFYGSAVRNAPASFSDAVAYFRRKSERERRARNMIME